MSLDNGKNNDNLEYLVSFAAAMLEITVEMMSAIRNQRPGREKRSNLRHPRTEEQIPTQNSFAPLQYLEENETNETAVTPEEPSTRTTPVSSQPRETRSGLSSKCKNL